LRLTPGAKDTGGCAREPAGFSVEGSGKCGAHAPNLPGKRGKWRRAAGASSNAGSTADAPLAKEFENVRLAV